MKVGRFSQKELLRTIEHAYGGPASERIRTALRLAFEGHRSQVRDSRDNSARIPFIVHPVGTACLAIKHYPSAQNIPDDLETVVCVALVHDLLEDTRVDTTQIRAAIDARVQVYAEALAKPPAGIVGRSAAERNKEFLDRIARAGPTAVFVKVCDSMHNLSRPASTPVRLMGKLIDKANDQYLPLLDRCPLGDQFKETYADAIETARQWLANEEQYPPSMPPPSSLEAAVALCNRESSGKVVELHDIVDILQRACGPRAVSIWRYSGQGDNLLVQVEGFSKGVHRKGRLPAGDLCEAPQELSGDLARQLGVGMSEEGLTTVFTVPVQADSLTRLVVALVFGAEGPPAWLSLDGATVIVQLLAHRLVLSQADLRTRLAGEASALGVKLDVELGVAVGVRPFELEQLQRWCARCQEATTTVEQWIHSVIASNLPEIPLAEEVRIHSRVKAVDSILRKFMPVGNRPWPEFEKLEDIAGVRVVCPTLDTLYAIEPFFTGKDAREVGLRLHPTVSEPRRDYISSPPVSGYRALHLILEVDTRLSGEGVQPVPCELQLRTIFQDSWAALSHATLYRASRNERRRLDKRLREIADAVRVCDNMAEELTTKFTGGQELS